MGKYEGKWVISDATEALLDATCGEKCWGRNTGKGSVRIEIGGVYFGELVEDDGERRPVLGYMSGKAFHQSHISDAVRRAFRKACDEGDVRAQLRILRKQDKELRWLRYRATERVELRVTPYEKRLLEASAKECGMKPATYLRRLMRGTVPRKAMTREEVEMACRVAVFLDNMQKFDNAARGWYRNLSPQERLAFIIGDRRYEEYRREYAEAVRYLYDFTRKQRPDD